MNDSSEARLQTTLNMIPAHTWYAAPAGALTFVNQRCADYLGLPKDHPLRLGAETGAAWDSHIPLLHPDDHDETRRVWSTCLTTESACEVSFRVRNAQGTYRWFLSRAEPLRPKDGTLLYWIGINIDIEEHRRAEEQLRQSESYLAEAQRLSHTGSWAWSPDTDVRYWSEECYRVLGFDPRDGLPRFEEFFQRIHPDDQPAIREQIQTIQTSFREKAQWEADYRIVHPDDSVRDIHVVSHPVLSTSGHLVELVGTVIDVTERKRAEEELRRSEMELRQILDLTPQMLAVLGPRRERLYANRATLVYLGVSLDDWRQGTIDSNVHPDDIERRKTYADRALLDGLAYELEVRLRNCDGSYRWFSARNNPLHDEQGRVIRWYVAYTDIEDRKRAEERLREENVALREEIDKTSMFEEIVGASPALTAMLSRVSKVAATDSTVLLTGETGTGKELVARAIHKQSPRSSRAFVSVNCAAIPRELIASELFGHEKGAFTGATQRRPGRFELADGGTIFLDEVGELLPDTQIALLRVLQEREFERVGGTQPIQVDVRVIAATNRDLNAAAASGTFRQDLFYRLNVFPLEMPPLRERKEDIPVLVEYFIDRYARKAGKAFRRVNKRTLDRLQWYPWPGNVRELQNVIERSVILSETDEFTIDESWLSAGRRIESRLTLSGSLAAHEKAIIEEALRASSGQVFGPSGAAARLGMPRSTLESKIRALGINKNRFRSRPARD
jgi:formate hydrogenlyase transcriptional activator